MRWAKGETWIADLTDRVPWAETERLNDRFYGPIELTWVSDEVVEGKCHPPRGAGTKMPVKTTLPAYAMVRKA